MYSPGGDESEGRAPPSNPLLRILYEAQRPLGAVAGAAEELKFRQEGLDPSPILGAMGRGFRQAKDFNAITKDPWLAFALNVGMDPVTWIPGGAFVKGAKGATKLVGLDKAYKYAQGVEAINRFDDKFGTLFKGPNYTIRKYNPKEVADALIQRNIDFDDFVSTFVSDVSEQANKLAASEEEQFALYRLLKKHPHGKTLADNIGTMSPDVIAEYNALSDGGKMAYRLAWETQATLESIMNSRGMTNAKAYDALKARVREQYKAFQATPNEAIANELKLDEVLQRLDMSEATVAGVVEKLYPEGALREVLEIDPNVPKQFKGLAHVAIKSRSEGNFVKNARSLPETSMEGQMVKTILMDGQLLTFREMFKQAITNMKWAMPDGEYEQVARFISENPKSKLANKFRKITGKAPRKEVVRRTAEGLRDVVQEQYPRMETIKKLIERTPTSTEYTGLRDFYRKTRLATDVEGKGLDEVLRGLGREMPQELYAKMSLKEIQRLRAELLGMKTDEAKTMLSDIFKALNNNRFVGLPLNIIRQSDVGRIAKINMDEIEVRLANALQVEGIAAARAVSNDNYHRWLFEWLHGKGLLMRADEFTDLKKRTEFFKGLREVLPEEEFAKRKLEGFAEVVSHPIFKGFALPKSLANEINAYTRIAGDPTKKEKFFEFWAKHQSLWKAWQLAIFPSYHVRNAVSNVWNNFIAGETYKRPIDIGHYFEAHRIQKVMREMAHTGKDAISPEDLALIRDLRRGVIGGEYAGELGRVLDRANPFQHRFAPHNFLRQNKVLEKGFGIGTYSENNARIAHYLWARNTRKLDHLESLKSVNKYLFDYRRGLTQFEDKYMRNFAVPFYAWTRFNMPLQLEMLAMQPAKYSTLLKAKEASDRQWGGPTPDEQFMSDWFKLGFNARVRYNEETGVYEYFFLDSWLPAADVSKLMSVPLFRDMLTSMVSPGLKMPPEMLYNFMIYKKKKIQEYGGQTVPVHLPGGKTINIPAYVDYGLRNMRIVNEVDRFFDESIDLSDKARWARIAIGKSYPYDPEKQKGWWMHKLNTQIRELEGHQARAENRGNERDAVMLEEKIQELKDLRDYYRD